MPPRKKAKTSSTAAGAKSKAASAAGPADNGATALSRRNVRGRRGGLKDIVNMPFDVLYEIFSALHPRDLLNLARTSTGFREVLMSRTSAPSWRAARHGVEGLPEIPPHMSEPAYANLLFFNNCFGCGKQGNFQLIGQVYARYCSSCKSSRFHSTALPGAPQEIVRGRNADLCSILNTVSFREGRHTRTYFHRPDMELVSKQWSKLKDAASKNAFIQDRIATVRRNVEHMRAVEKWQAEVQQSKEQEKAALIDERFAAVVSRLREEGWDSELDGMSQRQLDHLYGVDGVSRTTALTDRGWSTIRDGVVKFMEDIRAERIAREYNAKMSARLNWLTVALNQFRSSLWAPGARVRLIGGLADYALMPEVRTILEDDDSEEATQEVIVAKLTSILPTLTDKWAQQVREDFSVLAHNALGTTAIAQDADVLDLSVVAFQCRKCSWPRAMRWPEVANHLCLKGRKEIDTDAYEKFTYDVYLRNHQRVEMAYVGAAERISIDRSYPCLREVVLTCGLEPTTAKRADLDGCGVRLRCRLCARIVKQEVFDWEGAIAHDVKQHGSALSAGEIPHWDRVSEEHASQVRELQDAVYNQQVDPSKYRDHFSCTWCGECEIEYLPHIIAHLERRHGKQSPSVDVDYVVVKKPRPAVHMYARMLSKNEEAVKHVKEGLGFFVDSL